MFKRRDRRPIWRIVIDVVYPRGGWSRAAQYVNHRLRRLPDTPGKIGRGIWAGVFVCFTPMFGMHFLFATLISLVIRGNVLASLMATFFGNPLTFPAIGYTSLSLGSWLLGMPRDTDVRLGRKFIDAGNDLWHNIQAPFTSERADWHGLVVFYDDVFLPYLVGGIVPGLITATLAYYLIVPLITAYQRRRKKTLRAKLDQLKKKSSPANDDGQ